MLKNIKLHSNVFWQLLKTDLIVFKKDLIGTIIDGLIWSGIVVFVSAYILPFFGMAKEFGFFTLIGCVASWSLFEIWPSIATFIADIEGVKCIDYQITLPIPSWMVFIKRSLGYSLKAMVITCFIIPFGSLILWDKVNFTNFSFVRFIIIFITINLFSSVFGILLASLVENMNRIGKVWMRILFPMWFLGGAQFTWVMIYKLSPVFAYVSLCNPVLYAMEGIRSSVLGSEAYLPFWNCVAMLWFFTFLFGWIGIKRLEKRLDFI